MAGTISQSQRVGEIPVRTKKNPKMMHLPNEIFSIIMSEVIEALNLWECLNLRLVSRRYNEETLHLLFDKFQINRKLKREQFKYPRLSVNSYMAARYWFAFMNSEVPLHSYLVDQEPSEEYMRQHRYRIAKQSRFLNFIHRVLSEATDLLEPILRPDTSLQRGHLQYMTFLPNRSLKDTCTIIMCQASIALLGAQQAWTCLHTPRPAPVQYTLYRSPSRWVGGPFYEQHLMARSSRFWVTLAIAAYGDVDKVRLQIEPFRIHRKTSEWLQRLSVHYIRFSENSSPAERRWLEVLSGSLTIAVTMDNEPLVKFLLDQDPATMTVCFHSICYNKFNTIELAIQNASLPILDLLIRHRYFVQPLRNMRGHDDYHKALTAAAMLPQSTKNRNEIIKLLFSVGIEWQKSVQLRRMLTFAAERNDVSLAELIASELPDVDDCISDKTMHWLSNNYQHPLTTAAMAGHPEITHYLLQNATKLRLWDMCRQTTLKDEYKTATLIQLLKDKHDHQKLILNYLLEHTQEQRREQIQSMVFERGSQNLLAKYFKLVDMNSPISPEDDTTHGEVALLAAVQIASLTSCTRLVEDFGIRITKPRAISNHDQDKRALSSADRNRFVNQRVVRRYLIKHGMTVSMGWHQIWPVDNAPPEDTPANEHDSQSRCSCS